ncbi:MAG: DM13 domain-containing protein [Proteobacteria bacterium]|nr:DM13 domain-containing protein [Pseudomonadota bacterium]
MFASLLDFARRHIILFGTIKFASGLLIGLALGFAAGIYTLPILIADAPAPATTITTAAATAEKTTVFRPDLPDSDGLHWGDGTLYVTPTRVTLDGEVSPGPDYRLYLTRDFVDTTAGFQAIKNQPGQAIEVARIKGFKNFSYEIAPIDLTQYRGALIWCERFAVFITAGPLN